jgi:DNA mismatch repair protein MutS
MASLALYVPYCIPCSVSEQRLCRCWLARLRVDVTKHPPIHSPIRAQYLQIKRSCPDALLFFRMGDFYELFDEDAQIAARELEIALTKRDFGRGERAPMAGVPHQAVDGYIARLVNKGYRVAVCEQISDPSLSKGLVEREVVRLVTPGTVVDPAMLATKRNNFLAAAVMGKNAAGLAYVDITTGEFAVTQFTGADLEAALQEELARLNPAELLVEANDTQPIRALSRPGSYRKQSGQAYKNPMQAYDGSLEATSVEHDRLPRWVEGLYESVRHVTPYASRYFQEEQARGRLLTHFAVASLEGFGCHHLPLAVSAAGALLAYLEETQRGVVPHLTTLQTYSTAHFMVLDAHTRRNLELFHSGRGGGEQGSLLGILDQTQTPMGGRLLRRWLSQPLLEEMDLHARLDAVEAAVRDAPLRARLSGFFDQLGDLERLANRVIQRIATPRDLVNLAVGLRMVAELQASLPGVPLPAGGSPGDGAAEHASVDGAVRISNSAVSMLSAGTLPEGLLYTRLAALDPVVEAEAMIRAALVPDPPASMTEGGLIRAGFHEELDMLRSASRDAREWMADLERRERVRTGISNLKVSYNKVFGYYLEVTNSQLSRVPADYIRKQTLTTGERFITPDLKEYEALILNAQEKSAKLEQELFVQLRADLAVHYAERILATGRALAELDVYLSLAQVAARWNYCRPQINTGTTIHIVAGRHPVVEQTQADIPFIPNDAHLSQDEAQILLLTGPNMAGKSTYLRQVALIVLMAQIGSFVPAESASIELVDRIFTRIGAQDDLATGQSTFMVEMVETANILHHATPRSLVILDEIGRGTSTYDGLAIARAVIEYLHNNRRCGARTLFATHYHELVEVSRLFPRVRPCTVAVTEEEGQMVFLRKIVPGGADKSYGIHVAQLAGIPRQVIHRAQEILEELERKGDARARRKTMKEMTLPPALQLTLFGGVPDPLIDELKSLSIDEMTPLEAIGKLYELQQRARQSG